MANVLAYRLTFNVQTGEGTVALKVEDEDKPRRLNNLSPERLAAIGTVLRSDATISVDGPVIICGDKIE